MFHQYRNIYFLIIVKLNPSAKLLLQATNLGDLKGNVDISAYLGQKEVKT